MTTAHDIRICIDCRRMDRSGIGRITSELARVLVNAPGIRPLALCGRAGTAPSAELEVLPFPAPYLSLEEYENLSRVLVDAGVSAYLTPQFYNTPRLEVPLISWVHDTWPLRYPEWLPKQDHVFGKFGNDSREVARRLIGEFERARAAGALFQDNAFLKLHARPETPPLFRTTIAMFALNLQRSARIVTCSEDTTRDLGELFPEICHKVRLIYNPVPTLGRRATANVPEPSRDAVLRLLHVSKWEPRKNLEGLISAFSTLASEFERLELHLVGSAPIPGDAARVQAAIAANPARERIIVHGSVTDPELEFLYGMSTVLVVPSFFEGFSLPVVEAMAAGTPVVAARVGGIPEVAGDAAEFFDPYDVQDLTSTLRKVLLNPVLRDALVKRARARVKVLQARDFGTQIRSLIVELAEGSRTARLAT
jgi:glycosyltransferase involved in cell wall biosynthesis